MTRSLALVFAASLTAAAAAQNSAADRSVVDGVFTADQATAGREVFRKACASCHQLGDLAGPKFALRWEKMTVGDVFQVITDTMPDGAAGSLEPRAYASIVAMFLKESGYKEGSTELPSDVAALKKIKIEPLPAP